MLNSKPGKPSGQVIGVDVGGTFTDLVMFDQKSKKVSLAKVPSTVDNQAFGVLAALEEVRADLANIDLVVHGTTTTTNAVLERKLSKTGLITTRGFRDILELGRRTRPQPYGMNGEFEPIIPRDLRLEVAERMDAAGEVLTELDEEEVRLAAIKLREAGCEALVIHFLHSYANDAHEKRAAAIAAEVWPNNYISTGSALLSESREFERGVSVAVNASVQPLLERYISRLVDELSKKGYGGDVLVMNGNGGMVSSMRVAREAAKTVMSGPASGVMAAAYTGNRAGIGNLITYDMGGTSTDVALIRDAKPSVSNEIEVEYAMPIHVPMVDVRTVGAGGGSIAKVNSAGLLEIGPQSAGANPGPICYGLGGREPTISDANLLLGRLDTSNLKSISSENINENVAAIFNEKLAKPLGLEVTAAAAAVLQMANTKMAGAIRMVSISLGVDPRDFALFAFGGAGPLHASALARELGVPKVLIPARPGITNALGCIVADLRHDFVNTINKPLDSVDVDSIHRLISERMSEGEQLISKENIEVSQIKYFYSADMQFVGQTHLLRVELSHNQPSKNELQELFEKAYFNRFHVELNQIRANLVNINISVIGERDPLDLSTLIDPTERKASTREAKTGERAVYFDDWHDTPIYWRDHLPEKFDLVGPAIIEQMDTTILIEPGDKASGDQDGNIIIAVSASQDVGVLKSSPGAKASIIDPITLSVIQAGLQQVCDEMDLSFSRAAFSPVIAEANDRSDGIYSATDGSLIAQGAGGLPVFVGTMQYSTRTLIERIENGLTAKPQPDDIYIVNDPYLGGTHLMDVRFAKPYYRDGKIFCWLSNTGHWPDTGGSVPGGFSASATSVEQEGLRLPPVRLFKQGQLDEEIYAIICSNIRIADQRIGDVKAQAAALMEGEKRLDEILDRYGDDTVEEAISELRLRAADQMRACISQIEDGSYKSIAYVDSDGVVNEPLEIRLEITKLGDQLTFDFNGSSPPCMGPMNSVLATTLSSVYLAMRHIFPQVPISAGAFEPLNVIRPEGTFLDAQYPRPVSGCAAEVSQRIAEAVFAALVGPLPDLVTAAPAGTSGNFALGGYDSGKMRDFVMYQLSGGGYGGNADHDGLTNGCSTIGISKAPPVEIMEQAYPVLYHRYALREGSAGAGKHRGGFGIDYEVELRSGKATASFVMDHGRFGPQGALGGRDAEPNEVTVYQSGKAYTPEHLSKEQDIPMLPGDRVHVRTPGGGGYGDPYLRNPQAVLNDVRLGRFNLDQAQELFGVVINSDLVSVDEQKTKQLRAEKIEIS